MHGLHAQHSIEFGRSIYELSRLEPTDHDAYKHRFCAMACIFQWIRSGLYGEWSGLGMLQQHHQQ